MRIIGLTMKRLPLLVAACYALPIGAQPVASERAETPPSAPGREAYFGDLHLHTAYSFDAVASGTRTTPDDAYRYALGEPVDYLGRTIQRKRRLDFLAVTDHAEYLGVPFAASELDALFAGSNWTDRIAAVEGDTLGYMQLFSASAFRGTAPPIEEIRTAPIVTSLWQREIEAAERYNAPGEFTTLVAYEWSPMPGGAHLHRNVIFRGPDYPERPFSSLDSQNPEDLWTFVEQLRAQGMDSVLIPHNSNLSQGLMFAASDSYGEPITAEYAARRIANERLVEITQNKGTSEARPEFSPPDEFAGFELLNLPAEANADPQGGYARYALMRGLEIGLATGVNPFQFGFIGSSDFHSGTSATEEDNFSGALGRSDDMANAEAVLTEINPIAGTPATVFSASGMTAVWAEANTREAIFDALERREVFATSGTRIRVRLFAGFGYPNDLLEADEWVARAYRDGVPMGADLRAPRVSARASDTVSVSDTPTADRRLSLVVHALRDPDGANLDRVQIVKIWLEEGTAREAVFDVAWSGSRGREPATGRVPAIGTSVDIANASFANTIGAAELGTVWTDEDFDPAVPAIYYARVIEIPTPRWSTYLAVRNGLPVPDDVPAEIQERAWTSPIFYTP